MIVGQVKNISQKYIDRSWRQLWSWFFFFGALHSAKRQDLWKGVSRQKFIRHVFAKISAKRDFRDFLRFRSNIAILKLHKKYFWSSRAQKCLKTLFFQLWLKLMQIMQIDENQDLAKVNTSSIHFCNFWKMSDWKVIFSWAGALV